MVVGRPGVGSNRSGQPKVRNIGEAHLAPFRALTTGRWAFDGEVVGRTLHLFDMPAGGDHVSETTGFTRRREALRVTLEALAVDSTAITTVATAIGEGPSERCLQAAKTGHKEGITFRAASAGYQAGRSSVLKKHKFVKEIDAYVIEVGKGGKENAVLAVRNEAGEEVVVGQVSTTRKGQIRVGDTLEVQFLYVQPRETGPVPADDHAGPHRPPTRRIGIWIGALRLPPAPTVRSAAPHVDHHRHRFVRPRTAAVDRAARGRAPHLAKLFGVRVTQYMVGFGPTLFARTRGDTEYGLKVIPLAGYIRRIGMVPPGRDDAPSTPAGRGPLRSDPQLIEESRTADRRHVTHADTAASSTSCTRPSGSSSWPAGR